MWVCAPRSGLLDAETLERHYLLRILLVQAILPRRRAPCEGAADLPLAAGSGPGDARQGRQLVLRWQVRAQQRGPHGGDLLQGGGEATVVRQVGQPARVGTCRREGEEGREVRDRVTTSVDREKGGIPPGLALPGFSEAVEADM